MASNQAFALDPEPVKRANHFAVEILKSVSAESSGRNVVLCPLLLLETIHQLRQVCKKDRSKDITDLLQKYDLTGHLETLIGSLHGGNKSGPGADSHYELATSVAFVAQRQDIAAMRTGNVRAIEKSDTRSTEEFLRSITQQHVEEATQTLNPRENILLGAAHFFSDWENKFIKALTNTFEGRGREQRKSLPATLEDFQNLDGTISQVVTIHLQEKIFFTRDETLKATILELPLSHYDLSLALVVPDESGAKALEQIEKNITADTLGLLRKNWQMPLMHVYLPKFSITENISLNKALEKFGLKQALHEEHLDVAQFVDLEISSDCGDALPPSQPMAGQCSGALQPPTIPQGFHVNRPFIFFIYPRHPELYLMMGRITHLQTQSAHSARWNFHRNSE